MIPMLCCEGKNGCPAPKEPSGPCCTDCPVFACPPGPSGVSFGGGGLLLTSFKAVVEEDGVLWFELDGDWAWLDGVGADGEEVPVVDSFFFADLFESFARESCSC